MGYLVRNLPPINKLLDTYSQISFENKNYKYFLVINTVFQQQKEMYDKRTHRVDHRIVIIHQPHVRLIVRGKSQAKVEFGAKVHAAMIDGISFLDEINWEAFNESSHMMDYIEKYKVRFGYYPQEVLADQIYCTRATRKALKLICIKLFAKPLSRSPSVSNHVRPGERNTIEGKFGQAKTVSGLDRIHARLIGTSESIIASITQVINLFKLAGVGVLCLFDNVSISFSAKQLGYFILPKNWKNENRNSLILNLGLAA